MIQRKQLALGLATAMAFSAPLAFAQDAGQHKQETTTQAAETAAPEAAAAAPQAESRDTVSWADLDTDGNGSLSRAEAAAVPSLAQVFERADADKDGELTADEYKAFLAANYPAAGASGQED